MIFIIAIYSLNSAIFFKQCSTLNKILEQYLNSAYEGVDW